MKTNSHQSRSGTAEPQLRKGSANDDMKSEWYSRGYLPHRDRMHLVQSITFRLADSIPLEKLKKWEAKKKLQVHDAELGLRGPSVNFERQLKIEAWADAGFGCCALQHPTMAKVMEDTLLMFDKEKYHLLAWCIMPNHVHVVIETITELKKIVQSWKSFTGRWAMRENEKLGLGLSGKSFWMPDYWDRYIRNKQNLENVVLYIHENPVKAGLCKNATDWRWSSAR